MARTEGYSVKEAIKIAFVELMEENVHHGFQKPQTKSHGEAVR